MMMKGACLSMFGKSEDKSQKEVDEIIQRFNLQDLSQDEKNTLVSMARDRTLVSLSAVAVGTPEFMKTTVYQNWMILSQLSHLNKNIEKLLNK